MFAVNNREKAKSAKFSRRVSLVMRKCPSQSSMRQPMNDVPAWVAVKSHGE